MAKYVTKQRRQLLDYLSRHTDEQMTARQIADALTQENISLSAVYRNLSDLEADGLLKRSVREGTRDVFYQYIAALEEAIIRTVARQGIEAGRIDGASGVWLGKGVTPGGKGPVRKICAIGVRSSRYVTMHGFALNVSTDLAWFSRINPCGFTDRGVTSILSETGRNVPMEEVKRSVVELLSEILNVKIYKQ